MSLTLWPVKFKVERDATYWEEPTATSIHRYEGFVEITCNPCVIINIRDLYTELTTNLGKIRCDLYKPVVEGDGYYREYRIGKGYRLNPNKPIGPEPFVFHFNLRKGEIITRRAVIIMKVGIRTIRKPITLIHQPK